MHAFITPIVPKLIPSADIHFIGPETSLSIGIDSIRKLQSQLVQKPLQSSHHTVIIDPAHKLTHIAQNALLKTLEDPATPAEIFLVTDNPSALLPTVISRCQVTFTKKEVSDFKMAQELIGLSQIDRLKLLDSLELDRASFIDLLNQFEFLIHATPKFFYVFNTIHTAKKYALANVNLKLIFNYLALNL